MTKEEKKQLESRLEKVNKIENKIEILKEGLSVFDSGKIYLNASTFQKEHEAMSRALQLVEDSVMDVFKREIERLEKEWREQ